MSRIVITGNPGVGKSTISSLLSKRLDFKLISLNEFVIRNKLVYPDKKLDVYDVHIKKASLLLGKEINQFDDVIISGHLAPYLLKHNQADLVVVLRRSPKYLLETFKERKYTIMKIRHNITSEVIGVTLYDSIKKFGSQKIVEFDTTNTSSKQIIKRITESLKDDSKRGVENINWMSMLKDQHDILNLISY